jgi:hypothetical protein
VGLQGTPTKPSLPPRTRIGHSGLHHIYPYPAGMFLWTDSAWRPRFEAANSTRGTWQTQLWLAAWPSCTTRPSSRTWRPSTSFANPLSETPALPQKSTGEINACSLSFLAVRELLVASGGDTRSQRTRERAALFRAASSSDARCLAKPLRRSLRSSSEPCARTWTLSPVRSTCPILG